VSEHLGVYSDWIEHAIAPTARSGQLPSRADVSAAVQRTVSTAGQVGVPDVRIERTWTSDGLSGEEISYSVGFGPRTHTWVLKPADATGPLPGVVALHGHDGFKYYGKEKIADSDVPPSAEVSALRDELYEGRAFANELAAGGYVVVIPDVFCWGTRRFPLEQMPAQIRQDNYNAAAGHHEHLVEKYCTLLGTTMAAVVNREDRIALAYLRSRADTTDRTAVIGLSGGGCRAALLRATDSDLTAAVVVGMMGTYNSLLDKNVVTHTWMLMPRLYPDGIDWPDVAACQAPASLLVQYNRQDQLFPLDGAEAAHDRIAAHYAAAPASYVGQFYDGLHKFDREMQAAAFSWLDQVL
jgi:dienelactone hydrolase